MSKIDQVNSDTWAAREEFEGRSPADRIIIRENGEASTLVELLRRRALQNPQQESYTYLIDGETAGPRLTLAALERQARALGAVLQSFSMSGERALLLYPAGLEFITAFFGCLYAGVIAVPMPPPNTAQPQRSIPRLRTIAADARPRLVLTTSSILAKIEGLLARAPELRGLRWMATDTVASDAVQEWKEPEITRETIALLQYTSGSTAAPRGVMASHGNLIENSANISRAFEIAPESVSVSWLPVFHDMGLTNGVVQPLYGGRRCVLMPPQAFLQRPVRWLQAVSRYHATISGGPNFAYELCARKASREQIEALDLSSWRVAYSGAEPVRADTLKRFAGAFESCGFRSSAFYPCYGLAEATLIVTGGLVKDEPVLCTTQVAALEHHGVVESRGSQSDVRTLVGCGRAMSGSKVVIVDPASSIACAADAVGEIWVSGPSVTQGYWKRPEETRHAFEAYCADTGEGPFLRTGDLGFLLDGELFVTGRLKDLIIIGGRNIYPHDIETTVEQSHPALRPSSCVAFSTEIADEERLVVVAEVERRYQTERYQANGELGMDSNGSHADSGHREGGDQNGSQPNRRPRTDLDAVVRAIRGAVAAEHDVRVHAVVLMGAGGIPKTPSGKVQRRVCEARFRDGTLEHFAKNE